MAGQAEEEDDNDRRPILEYWDDRGSDEDKEKPVQGLRRRRRHRKQSAAAVGERSRDGAGQRICLVKLGEIPDGQQDPRPVRFIQPEDEQPTAELLEQLRDAWSASGGNELIIKCRRRPNRPRAETKRRKRTARPKQADGASRRIAPPTQAINSACTPDAMRSWTRQLVHAQCGSRSRRMKLIRAELPTKIRATQPAACDDHRHRRRPADAQLAGYRQRSIAWRS